MSTTPNSSSTSPNPPLSPPASARYLDPEQRQLSYYHQHLLAQSAVGAAAGTSATGKKPVSPKLAPLPGSPGPVTPLELEGDNYLTAGTASAKSTLSVDAIIREESKRRGDISPRRTSQ